jgi:hypothetical protein
MKFLALVFVSLLATGSALASPSFDRSSWTNWQGKWSGDFWSAGHLDNSKFMTCVGVDGSHGSPEYWSAGNGEEAARSAYEQILTHVNVAERNPAYIEVHCGY